MEKDGVMSGNRGAFQKKNARKKPRGLLVKTLPPPRPKTRQNGKERKKILTSVIPSSSIMMRFFLPFGWIGQQRLVVASFGGSVVI